MEDMKNTGSGFSKSTPFMSFLVCLLGQEHSMEGMEEERSDSGSHEDTRLGFLSKTTILHVLHELGYFPSLPSWFASWLRLLDLVLFPPTRRDAEAAHLPIEIAALDAQDVGGARDIAVDGADG